jgi:two-component system sensor histidine kinase UhpB
MHGMIPRLSPLVLDRFGLAEALADLAERTRRSQKVDVELQVDLAGLGEATLAPDTALAVYRAAQEGMSNALRHGQATRLQLDVQVKGAELMLELADNGSGLPAGNAAASPGHHGVRWMAERAQALGGRFELLARAAGGTLLRLQLPLPLPAKGSA